MSSSSSDNGGLATQEVKSNSPEPTVNRSKMDCSKPFTLDGVSYDVKIELDCALKALLLPESTLDPALVLIWVMQVIVMLGIIPNIGEVNSSPGFWKLGTQTALLLASIALAAQLIDHGLSIYSAYYMQRFVKTINPNMDFSFSLFMCCQCLVLLLFYIATIRVMAQQTSIMDIVVDSAGLLVIFDVDDLLVSACKLTGYTNIELMTKYDELSDSVPNDKKPAIVGGLTALIFFGTWLVAS